MPIVDYFASSHAHAIQGAEMFAGATRPHTEVSLLLISDKLADDDRGPLRVVINIQNERASRGQPGRQYSD
jgi:hypothetical protein